MIEKVLLDPSLSVEKLLSVLSCEARSSRQPVLCDAFEAGASTSSITPLLLVADEEMCNHQLKNLDIGAPIRGAVCQDRV